MTLQINNIICFSYKHIGSLSIIIADVCLAEINNILSRIMVSVCLYVTGYCVTRAVGRCGCQEWPFYDELSVVLHNETAFMQVILYDTRLCVTPIINTSIGTRSAFLSMKAAELKCQNFIVKQVCQVQHFLRQTKNKRHRQR